MTIKKIKFNIRVQLVAFNLPSLAYSCNITQFNGYNACPFCKIHGYAIGRQAFYSFSSIPAPLKSGLDYLQLSTNGLPRLSSHGIKGPIPLTKIMIFPIQIGIDYMHLVCSGHMKTLIQYWNKLFLPNIFEQASSICYFVTLI